MCEFAVKEANVAKKSKSRQIYESLSRAARYRLWLMREGYANPRGRRPKGLDDLVKFDWSDLTAMGRLVAVHCSEDG